jgi:hypothetical protein
MSGRLVLPALLAAGFVSPASATQIRFIPVAERVGACDVVVVGTVAEVEPDPVLVAKGGPKTRYRVARVKIGEALLGAAGLTEIKVAFIGAEDQPKDGLKIPTPVLEKDNEVLLFLRKRTGDDRYYIFSHFGAVGKTPTNPYLRGDLKAETDEARPLCKLMADPAKALKSEAEKDRMLTAWMLLTRYRTYPADLGLGTLKEEAVPAAESKLVLENLVPLAAANGDAFRSAVSILNLTKADGFDGSVHGEGGAERTVRWLKDHTATYQLKKYVVEKK